MKILKLKLVNFGKHKKLEVDASGTVIGLLGENGAGKSCVLKAIKFLFDGELPDKANSWIHHGEKSATVEGEFEKDGKVGKIYRKITGTSSSRSFTWDDKEYKKAKEVDFQLESIFGSDKKAIANAVFINQGELDKILFGSDAERNDLFIKLLNLSFCEKHANVIDGKIKKLSEGIVDVSEFITKTKEAIEQLKAIRDNAETEHEASKKWLTVKDKVNQLVILRDQIQTNSCTLQTSNNNLSDLRDELEKLPEPTVDLQNVKSQISNLEKQAEEALNEYNLYCQFSQENKRKFDLSEELTELQTDLPSINEEEELKLYENATTEILEIDKSLLVRKQVAEKQKLLQAHATKAASLPKPSGLSDNEVDGMQKQASELLAESNQLSNWVKVQEEIMGKLDKPGGICFKCGLKLSNENVFSVESITETKNMVNEKQSKAIELQQMSGKFREQNRQAETAMTTWQSTLTQLTNDVKIAESYDSDQRTTAELQELKSTLIIENNQRKLQLDVYQERSQIIERVQKEILAIDLSKYPDFKVTSKEDYEKKKAEITGLRSLIETEEAKLKARQQCEAKIETLQGSVTEIADALGKYVAKQEALFDTILENDEIVELADKTCIVEKLPEVQSFIEAHAVNAEQAKIEYEVALGNLASEEQRLTDYETRQSKDQKKLMIIRELQNTKAYLKKDALPAAVVKANFRSIANVTQECLSLMDTDYNIFVDDTKPIAFTFQRLDVPDSGILPQTKMSGGQRVRLSIAFLMAVQQLLIPDFGFLVLDEPSQHLDEKARNSLADLIMKMNQTLQNTDHQIWVCDHSVELERSFNTIIKLKV
jgi:DNA repair exonuclease SbcCD ATPase subunit